jgi:phenylpropionate dioxygenase-like ring-hydroxylating dioxygenase large terminal subunit
MFDGFANVWTPVAASRALQDRPLPVKLAGEPLVLFRDKSGRIGALIDRCPHRGVALSSGAVDADGCLQCPFHGWSFRVDGACAHVPLSNLPEARRERYAATAVPVRDVGGLLWVFTGPDPAGIEPELPPALLDPAWHTWPYEETWNVHWTRAMENMLDMVHVPFVHRRTFGRQMRSKLRRDSVLRTEVVPQPWGARINSDFDGEHSRGVISWRRPNGMELHVPLAFRQVRLHVYCVPIGENRTRMILVNARGYLRGKLVSALLDRGNGRILKEDRAVVESAQPPEVPPPGEERSVANDGPTLYFRGYYYRELRGSSAKLLPAGRLAARAAAEAKAPDAAAPNGAEVLPLTAKADAM